MSGWASIEIHTFGFGSGVACVQALASPFWGEKSLRTGIVTLNWPLLAKSKSWAFARLMQPAVFRVAVSSARHCSPPSRSSSWLR